MAQRTWSCPRWSSFGNWRALVPRPPQQLIRVHDLLAPDGEPRAQAALPDYRERRESRRKGTVVSRIRTSACDRQRQFGDFVDI
jgi:hypothetical protein